jgi:hypothetical protein
MLFSSACCEPYAPRALRDAKMPVTFVQLARLIESNRSFATLAFMAVVALLVGGNAQVASS